MNCLVLTYHFFLFCLNLDKSPVTSQSFDITLMTCLLKNLTPMSIGDGLPLKSNIKEEADISRLKWYRNKVFHLQPTEIDDQTFVEWSTDILQVTQIKFRAIPISIQHLTHLENMFVML